MKFALLLCAVAGTAAASQPVLVRVTAETLARLQEKDPMIRLVKPAEAIEVRRPSATSPVLDSTILNDGTHWTMVPKGAVVHLPATHQARVDAKPVGSLLSWQEFSERNKRWIETTEVSFEQAAGVEEIPSATKWPESGKVVIASHQLGPISVRIASPETTAKP
jgi:hypothetical protein